MTEQEVRASFSLEVYKLANLLAKAKYGYAAVRLHMVASGLGDDDNLYSQKVE